MNKLLRVSGRRLFKDKVFYLAIFVTLVISVFISLTNAPVMAEWALEGDDEICLESCYYNLAPLIGLIFASFVSLFLGVEHSDGTLRNKLIAGHSRSAVFLSYFTISALGCLIVLAAFLIGGLPGLYYFKAFEMGWKVYFLSVLVLVCGTLLFAAIYTTISMLIPNKAISAVASLLLWFVMLFVGSIIVNALSAPEMISDYALVNGQWVAVESFPNPGYVDGAKRTILEILSHIDPVCASSKMANIELEKPFVEIVYSLSATAAVLLGGCIAFRKKDLK